MEEASLVAQSPAQLAGRTRFQDKRGPAALPERNTFCRPGAPIRALTRSRTEQICPDHSLVRISLASTRMETL